MTRSYRLDSATLSEFAKQSRSTRLLSTVAKPAERGLPSLAPNARSALRVCSC